MGDLRATLMAMTLRHYLTSNHIAQDEKATVEEFREKFSQASPRHILLLFATEKIDAIFNILQGVESLEDFHQRLG